MTGVLEYPRRLRRTDDVSDFNSGADELDDWLRRFAWENSQAGNAVTYVTVQNSVVLGYYALAVASYLSLELPDSLRKNRPAQTPCILLARLAVDTRAQGQGIGSALLRDAIERTYQLSTQVGIAALLIHCRDDEAKSWYQSVTSFQQSPVNPSHLMLSLKEIRRKLNQ